ncbi:SDR family NAD(P)-dependent oxidoreductase [Demequina pelophila]|uniref:SDR family NAD(P)-dependent oxidoreductase n=1 Tax=Demequina pelophila TaxID=1638984 RepID=UPI000784DCBA|nr:SDR family NAD(P)-dependent oxidoreductase [Demequina pelophila]
MSPTSTSLALPGGDDTVAAWLDHPYAGAALRDALAAGGADASSLAPAMQMTMAAVVASGGGRFPQEMVDGVLAEARRRMEADGVEVAEPEPAPESDAPAPAPAWRERITEGRFTGQTVIVTGAGSGIGRATASRVAREGGRVIALDISQERLADFAAEHDGLDVTVVTADVTKAADIERVLDAAGDTIDALANVAGIMDNMTPLGEVSDEVWQRVFAVNVDGVMRLSRAVVQRMLPRRRGSIVNVASEAALRGSAAGVAYTASKHAVVGITKSSSFMYAPHGLRVNAIAPGGVATNIGDTMSYGSELAMDRLRTAMAILPPPVTPDQLAASICFLLSDDGVNLNGVILPSDGGWAAI